MRTLRLASVRAPWRSRVSTSLQVQKTDSIRWLHAQRFDDAPSRAAFVDYLCAVEALVHRRRALIAALEQAAPGAASRGRGGR